MTNTQSPAPGVVAIEPKKLQPGTPEHFAFLGVPYGWNFLKGKDYADMQGFAKAVWDAALKNAWAAERRHDEFDLMLSTLRYIVGAEPAAAGMTARDHYNAVIKALGSWPSQPEQAAKRIDAMLAKFPLYPRPAPAPQAAGVDEDEDDGVPLVPIATVYRGGVTAFGKATCFRDWLPGSEQLPDGEHTLFAAITASGRDAS